MKIHNLDNRSFNIIGNNSSITDELPKGIYTLVEEDKRFSLKRESNILFDTPCTLYGRLPKIIDKLTSQVKNSNIGIALFGEKGIGKSIIAKSIYNNCKYPLIKLASLNSYTVDYVPFLTSLEQKFILLIDEFDKIFNDKREQSKLLSLLDGNATSNIVFIITGNDTSFVSSYLKSRTSRIKYFIELESLSKEEINEVIDDFSLTIEQKETINKLTSIIGSINYDILKTIIKEVQDYPEYTINDLLFYLNIGKDSTTYDIKITNSKGWEANLTEPCNIFGGKLEINEHWIFNNEFVKDSEGKYEYSFIEFDIKKAISYSYSNQCITVKQLDNFDEEVTIVFTPIKKQHFIF